MSVREYKIIRHKKTQGSSDNDKLAIEEPLQISISGSFIKNKTGQKNIAVTMRTPGADKELAVGFLYGEGLLSTLDQITNITVGENRVEILLMETDVDWDKLHRNFYTSSSCGVCGKASIESLHVVKDLPPSYNQVRVSSELIYRLSSLAKSKQELFHKTGGIHAATIFDLEGNVVIQCEDVGRHNALDKAVGSAFLSSQLPLDQHILLLSGRASFELLQKSLICGIQVVTCIGAPSSLAVDLATEYDITLIGFLREESFNIYSAEHRLRIT